MIRLLALLCFTFCFFQISVPGVDAQSSSTYTYGGYQYGGFSCPDCIYTPDPRLGYCLKNDCYCQAACAARRAGYGGYGAGACGACNGGGGYDYPAVPGAGAPAPVPQAAPQYQGTQGNCPNCVSKSSTSRTRFVNSRQSSTSRYVSQRSSSGSRSHRASYRYKF